LVEKANTVSGCGTQRKCGDVRDHGGIAMTVYQSGLATSVLIVRIPTEGIEDFRAYEDAVLPLLPEFNGRLERRLRNQDGTIEIHVVSFASDADRQNYRNDPRRMAQAWLLEKSSAKLELLPMWNVS
jgi:hypothetical protein